MGFLPNAQLNAAIEAMFPSVGITRHVTATSDGSKTVTLDDVSDSLTITPGMVITGTGITGTATVSSVNNSTGVVTATGGTWSGTGAGVYTFTQQQWGSLHTANPSTTGASETTDANYTRQQISWTAAASGGYAVAGTKSNSAAVTWPAGAGSTGFAGSVTITDFGFFSKSGASGGTWLGGGAMTSITVPAGAQIYAAVGAITVAESG